MQTDADPYIPGGGGAQYWINQNNLCVQLTWKWPFQILITPAVRYLCSFRSVRNFVIDLRQVPPEKSQGTGLHWQVSQSTSLVNIVVHMSTAPNTAHQGIWMENGRRVGYVVTYGGLS